MNKYAVQVYLDRPEKKNALSLKLIQKLMKTFKEIPEDTRVLVLRGEGDFFCSGLDLHELQSADAASFTEAVKELFYTLATLPCITIAVVHGGAFAGGLGLIAACDLVIASRESMFALPELKRGVVPSLVFALLKRQIPFRFLQELILVGEPITAVRAHAIGLINEVIALEETDSYLHNLIGQLLRNAPEAMFAYKKHFGLGLGGDSTLLQDLNHALELHRSMLGSKESLEGLASFIEKRPPSWLLSEPPTQQPMRE
jgi:methylglutaconyl-CoA hydratase